MYEGWGGGTYATWVLGGGMRWDETPRMQVIKCGRELLPMVVDQLQMSQLNHRYRGQAPSHILTAYHLKTRAVRSYQVSTAPTAKVSVSSFCALVSCPLIWNWLYSATSFRLSFTS